jgi:hypothetical protein
VSRRPRRICQWNLRDTFLQNVRNQRACYWAYQPSALYVNNFD